MMSMTRMGNRSPSICQIIIGICVASSLHVYGPKMTCTARTTNDSTITIHKSRESIDRFPLDDMSTEMNEDYAHATTESSISFKNANFISECPMNCHCIISERLPGLIVNCSRRNMATIPNDLPQRSRYVSLQGNLLTVIPNFAFRTLNYLNTLDVSHNTINKLFNQSFFGLHNLEVLFLNGNNLAYRCSIAIFAFRPLKSLLHLQIQKNCDSASNAANTCSYHDHAITYASKLTTLVMDGFPNKDLGPGFKRLQRLKYLSMNGKQASCHLNHITNTTFASLYYSGLTELDLSHCGVWFIDNNSLNALTTLEVLKLEHNVHLCRPGLHNVTKAVSGTHIQGLFLKRTCIEINLMLDPDVFEPLSASKLRQLDLQHTHLSYISQHMIASLPFSLQKFSFYYNNINDAAFLMRIVFMPNIEWLDGSYQNHYSVSGKPDTNFTIHWPTIVPLPPKLKFINASFLKLPEYFIPEINFSTNNVLEVIDVSSNFLNDIRGVIRGLKSLRHLFMANNLIEHIHPNAFSDMTNLEYLSLSGNVLGSQTTLSSKSFSNLSRLTTLDLSNNKCKQFSKSIFKDLVSLKNLYLDYNALTVVRFDVRNMLNLSLLTLQQNKLLYIDGAVLNTLDRIGIGHELAVSLSGNQFQCDCLATDKVFIKWLSETGININDRNKIYCKLSNDSLANLTTQNTRNIISFLNMSCIWWEVLACSVSLFLLLNLILGLVALLYKQRWKLRYLYYTGRHKVNPYHPLEDDTIAMETDVYISFDEMYVFNDGQELYYLLSNTVYARLQHFGLSVKIRHELRSGRMMHDVISSALRHSRKVLAFITKDYCREFWNTFEFNMAAHDGLYTKRNVVIPIIVGEVHTHDLLPEILAFLANKTPYKVNSSEDLLQIVEILVSKIREN